MKKIFLTLGVMISLLVGGGNVFADDFSKDGGTNPPAIPCAAGIIGCSDSSENNYTETSFFEDVVPRVIRWMLAFTASLAVLVSVIAGVMFLFGGASEELLGRAKKAVIYAVVGLLLAMFAFAIVQLINSLPFPGASNA